MGNEFGHREWLGFLREGNEWSHTHCRYMVCLHHVSWTRSPVLLHSQWSHKHCMCVLYWYWGVLHCDAGVREAYQHLSPALCLDLLLHSL
jgi:hypothetical protein